MEGSNNPAGDLITSKDWTLEHLLATGERFRPVDSISAKSVTPEQIALTIKEYEERGVPLVVQDLHLRPNWPELFTPRWLETHYGSQGACAPEIFVQVSTSRVPVVEVRNVHGDRLDRESTITELIDSLRNAPPFAHQGGMAYHFTHLRHSPNVFSRTRTLVRQGYALSVGVERLDQVLRRSAQCGHTRGNRRCSPRDGGNVDELFGDF